MSRRRLCHLAPVAALLLAGSVGAEIHAGDALAAYPGQAAGDVGFAAFGAERGYSALFEDDNSPRVQLPFSVLGDDGSGLSFGPLLRYRGGLSGDVVGLDRPDELEAGGFIAWRSGPWALQGHTLGASPLAGDAGLLGLTGSYALQGGERLTLVFSGSAAYASDGYLRQRLPGDAGLADLPYDGRGLGNLGVGVDASYRLGSAWSLVGMFGIHHTLNGNGEFLDTDDALRFRAGAAFRFDF